MTQIRSFRNADLPILVDLWIQHWSAVGPPPAVNAPRLEQAVLARTFFDPANLLLAETEGEVQAWIHVARLRTDNDTASIAALCMSPSCDASVSGKLLEAAESRIAELGLGRIYAGAVRDDQLSYTGLDPIGHGIGIPTRDLRASALLKEHGYAPQRNVARMMASATGYRPPVNRESLQFRRTSRTETASYQPQDAWRASAMSHLDVEEISLIAWASQGGAELARIALWLSDPEAEVMPSSAAILEIAEPHERGRLESAENYLIGAVVQSLADRRVSTIETAVDEEKTELVEQLKTLQFQIAETGVRWQKSLTT